MAWVSGETEPQSSQVSSGERRKTFPPKFLFSDSERLEPASRYFDEAA